jgi:hypothetical protein
VVVRALESQWTTDVGPKFVPFTVRVKAGSSTVSLFGLKLVVVGMGLLTVKVWALDSSSPCPGFNTVTLAVSPHAISDAGM